eukprot:jgi/Bigna1/81104/fgenesh1_pg.77_\
MLISHVIINLVLVLLVLAVVIVVFLQKATRNSPTAREQNLTIRTQNMQYERSKLPSYTQGDGEVNDNGVGGNGRQRDLVAVCIVGEFRTFLQAEVQASFVNMIHHPGYEYFVVTDKPFPVRNGDDNVVHNGGAAAAADDVGVQVSPLRSWVLDRLYQHIELKSVFGGVQGGIMSGRPNTPRLAQCYYEILSEEGRRNIRYKTVFKIRPDHIFNERIPHVGDSIAFRHPEGTVHIWDDQMAVSRRSDAKWILLTPTVAYSTCASEDDWRM